MLCRSFTFSSENTVTDSSIVLTDVANGIWRDSWSMAADDTIQLPGSADWSIEKRTLRGGVSDGVDVVEINNGALTVRLLPTRGMGLWNAEYGGVSLGWRSPVALPVNPAFVNQESRGGLGWLSGFNELLCRCGLASNGPPGIDVLTDSDGNRSETPLTLHGLIANTPAHYVEVSISDEGPGTISVTGIVDESSLFGSHLRLTSTLTTEVASNRMTITDEITNLAADTAEIELLYHTNIGKPLLGPGARVSVPFQEMAPSTPIAADGIDGWHTYGAPKTGFAEQVYFFVPAVDGDGNTMALLQNASGDFGVSLSFNIGQLPYFILWKNTQAEADGYVTGLEPATDLPNLRTFEREKQRLLTLPPGGSYVAELRIAAHGSAHAVADAERRIADLQSLVSPEVHTRPHPNFSPTDG